MSYTTLIADLASWLHRADLTTQIATFISDGEKRIYRDLRIRAMEAALSDTIASGVIAVPSGYIAMKNARIDSARSGKLMRKDAEWIYANYPVRSADGTPKFFAREIDSFIFGPYPDSAYTVKGTYYKRLDALSTENETNWFTENAQDLLRWAALCSAARYIVNDQRIPVWEENYAEAILAIQAEDDAEEFSGSPLQVTPR
jgi:hypothetical protein